MDCRRVCSWLALALSSGLAMAQQPAKGMVPRTVRVYVVVTTASGQLVTDLDKRDFSLWDNNVLPMNIMSFKLIRKNSNHLAQPALISTEPQSGDDDAVVAYELTFDVPVGGPPNEYHSLGVRVDRPGLKVRAPQGYFARP